MLALRLPPDIEKRLDALARKTGRTKSFYGREAILRHLDDLEDMYLAEKILDRIKTSKERTFTIDEVERELGLQRGFWQDPVRQPAIHSQRC